VADLTAAQLEQLRADPGYTVVPLQLGVRGEKREVREEKREVREEKREVRGEK
jgi:hypothetical protein